MTGIKYKKEDIQYLAKNNTKALMLQSLKSMVRDQQAKVEGEPFTCLFYPDNAYKNVWDIYVTVLLVFSCQPRFQPLIMLILPSLSASRLHTAASRSTCI